jgi:hypothetical protein
MAVGLVRRAPPPPAGAGSWREHLLTLLGSTFDDAATATPPAGREYGHLLKLLLTGEGGASHRRLSH